MAKRHEDPAPHEEALHILCVEPDARFHEAFGGILAQLSVLSHASYRHHVTVRPCVRSAMPILQHENVAVVFCESQTATGSWRELLELIGSMNKPPLLIVTSRFADEHLWAEALNLGAYDVLAKPYNAREVERVVGLAHSHWRAERSALFQAAG
jgi:DNA-binding NtrC family response regulator